MHLESPMKVGRISTMLEVALRLLSRKIEAEKEGFLQGYVAAFSLGPLKGTSEQILHGMVMEQNPTQHSQMPDIMATPKVIK